MTIDEMFSNTSPSFRAGWDARCEGKPRTAPHGLAFTIQAGKEWFAGWDAAQVAINQLPNILSTLAALVRLVDDTNPEKNAGEFVRLTTRAEIMMAPMLRNS